MPLDLTKPHGVIYGNHEARYEQDGIMYDGAGRIVASGNIASPDMAALAETGITTAEPGVATRRGRGGSNKTPVAQ